MQSGTAEFPPPPLGIHPDSKGAPVYAICIDDGRDFYVLRWCWRNKCGGILSRAQNRWTLTTPISFGDFLELLKTDPRLPPESFESFEMRCWIKACRLASSELEGT